MFKYTDVIKNVSQVKKASLLVYSVSKREVMNKDYKRIISSLDILKKAGKESKRKLCLSFDGYDNDKREIYEIPEIREFVKYIYDNYKYLFYFLTLIDNNRNVIYACINDLEVIHRNDEYNVKYRIIPNQKIKQDTVNAMLEYAIQIGETEMQEEIFTFI